MASLMGPSRTASAASFFSGLLAPALMGPSGTASAVSLLSVLLAAILLGHSGAAAGPAVNFSALTLPSDFLYSRSGMNSLPPRFLIFLLVQTVLNKKNYKLFPI
jgi:hypothetical protein